MASAADIARTAALLADATRVRFLLELRDGPLPSTDLAARAGVSASMASIHLARLAEGGLVEVEPRGRHRFYRLRDPAVAQLVEALARPGATRAARPPHADAGRRRPRAPRVGAELQDVRTCYDHLGGRVGVAVTDALAARGWIRPAGEDFTLTPRGERELSAFGVEVASLRSRRRAFARACLDWTERRPHLAGALGAAFADRLFELGWLRRRRGSRAVVLTPAGRRGLRDLLGVEL